MAIVSRKSLVASRNIPTGTIISKTDLTLKRPGTGMPASHVAELIGKKTSRDIPINKLISLYDIEEG